MALQVGNQGATAGMAKAIFDQLDALLSPALSSLSPADLELARDGWRKLAFAVAGGVVGHIVANMEVYGIQVGGQNQTGPTTGHIK
jgi:hypothetical protein